MEMTYEGVISIKLKEFVCFSYWFWRLVLILLLFLYYCRPPLFVFLFLIGKEMCSHVLWLGHTVTLEGGWWRKSFCSCKSRRTKDTKKFCHCFFLIIMWHFRLYFMDILKPWISVWANTDLMKQIMCWSRHDQSTLSTVSLSLWLLYSQFRLSVRSFISSFNSVWPHLIIH